MSDYPADNRPVLELRGGWVVGDITKKPVLIANTTVLCVSV